MLRTAHFSRSVGRSVGSSVGRSVGRRDEKLSAASAAAVAAVASSGDEERDECLPNNVVFVGGGGDGVQVEAVVRVKVVVLSVAKSSSSGHSRKFPHKVGGSASLLRTRLIVLWGKPERNRRRDASTRGQDAFHFPSNNRRRVGGGGVERKRMRISRWFWIWCPCHWALNFPDPSFAERRVRVYLPTATARWCG